MKVTIIIVCFNEKPTILKVIDQAKEMNIDKELIILDNCSTDGTREILEGLKGDKLIQISLHSRNMGVGYSVSEGISLAKGDYIYISGADLEYKMSDLYEMIEKIEREKLDAVFGSRLMDRPDVSS